MHREYAACLRILFLDNKNAINHNTPKLKVMSISVKHSRWGPGDVSEIIIADRYLHTPPALQHCRGVCWKGPNSHLGGEEG